MHDRRSPEIRALLTQGPIALRGSSQSLAPGSSPVSRVAPPAPTGELLPSPIPDGKGRPSLPLHRYGVGVDCHSRFCQVCILIPQCTELARIEPHAPALWPALRAPTGWVLHTVTGH